MKPYLYIFISIFLITSTGCVSIPFSNPPKPSGNLNVGTQSFELIDLNREEWFTDNQNDLRKIMVQVWYPTEQDNGQRELYIDNGNIRIKALADQFEYNPSLFRKLVNIETNSIKEAVPYNSGSYPLIIFSHGLGGNRTQNTIMIEELVSNGYVVIAVEHAYDANVSIFDNGDIADYRSGINYNRRHTEKLTPQEFWDIREPQLKTRAADVSFLIDEIEEGRFPEKITQIINLDKIGIFGHSFGGATSIFSSYSDHRIDACVNLDGWMVVVPDNIINDGIKQSFMYIGQENWDEKLNYEKLDKFIESNKNSSKILIPGTTHYDFSDTPHMSKVAKLLKKSGNINSDDLKNILNELLLSFFNHNLKDTKIDFNYSYLALKYEMDMIVNVWEKDN